MYSFQFHRPATVKEATDLLAKTPDAKALAGGHTMIPAMKLRLAQPSALIDLSKISGLDGIELKGKTLVIGAMARHAAVANSDVVKKAIPALAELAAHIGDPAVRHRGTIGGSVANHDPAADYPAAVLGLGATVITTKRKIGADDCFKGLFETALGEDELITSFEFPVPDKAAYQKFPNPASRYALVGVFVAKTGNNVRVAVTGAGSNGVFRATEMEKALAKSFKPEALDGITIKPDDLNSDIHGSAAYRAHLIGVMAKRAVAAAG